jgi:hypothetical protein
VNDYESITVNKYRAAAVLYMSIAAVLLTTILATVGCQTTTAIVESRRDAECAKAGLVQRIVVVPARAGSTNSPESIHVWVTPGTATADLATVANEK